MVKFDFEDLLVPGLKSNGIVGGWLWMLFGVPVVGDMVTH